MKARGLNRRAAARPGIGVTTRLRRLIALPAVAAATLLTLLVGLPPAAHADSAELSVSGPSEICLDSGRTIINFLNTLDLFASPLGVVFADNARLTVTATSSDSRVLFLNTNPITPADWNGSHGLINAVLPVSIEVRPPLGRLDADITATVTGPTVAGGVGTVVVTGVLSTTVKADCTRPVLTTPGPVTVPATSPAGAPVTFTVTAQDAVTTDPPVTCDPASGSVFPIGTTTVTCRATDAAGNTGTHSFDVVVTTTPPVITGTPATISVEATTPLGAPVTYTPPTATDQFGANVPVTCSPPPGSTFPVGSSTVTCQATNAGGPSTSTFTVIVTAAPPTLALPGDQTVEATGPAGAAVTYAATAVASGAPVPVTCTPGSGSGFPLGTTPVTCTATSASGLTATGGFNVTVRDTTAPVVTAPANITLNATGLTGAPATWTATAADAVSGSVPVTCTPASGSTFGPGTTTTVTCTATDTAGNTGRATFTVTVRGFTLKGFFKPVTPSTGTTVTFNTVKAGSTVPLKFQVLIGTTVVTTPTVVRSTTVTPVSCTTGQPTGPATTISPTGESRVEFEAGDDNRFEQDWKTPKAGAGTCQKVTLTTTDNSTLIAYFKLV